MATIDATMALLRDGAEVLIPTGELDGILTPATESSKALQMMKRLPNMSSTQTQVKVLDQLIMAGHVNGDVGLKGISNAKWKDKYLVAEEVAVIVPIPDAVADDAEYDLWGLIKEQVPTAFGRVIDGSVFFGVDKPTSHPACILDQVKNYGKTITLGTGNTDLYDKMLGVDGCFDSVEKDGFDVTGILSSVRAKAMLRGLKDTTGRPLYLEDMKSGIGNYSIGGVPTTFAKNGVWNDNKALLMGGDFSELVYAVRSDVAMKIFDTGVITDNDGKIIYNLMQQDMKAIRFTFRYAWQVPNTMTLLNEDSTTRFPMFVLEKNADSTTRQTVTFTVTDGALDAVEGAYVDVAGAVKKTNSSGVATAVLQAGSYKYKVSTDDATFTGYFTVESSAVPVAVTLASGSTTEEEA